MNNEQNKCTFCGEIKPVSRFYIRVGNRHFDDNKKGKYSDFFYYCVDCGIDTKSISDGYHTFNELYEHRIRLWIEICKDFAGRKVIWASTKHHDGSSFGDWFILGMSEEKGKQITYHLPARFWSEVCEIKDISILEKAPEWDGHTSKEVLERLARI